MVAYVNNAPTDIALSNTSIEENLPIGTAVGTLTTTDLDPDTFIYSLVDNPGVCVGTDNTSFSISGDQLLTGEVFDYEAKNSYTICVQSDDNNGGTFEKQFTITVGNVIEILTAQFKSKGTQDGWILESGEYTNQGGTINKGNKVLKLGDSLLDQQYRAILSFNTSSLPDNAVITKVTLKVKKQGIVGTKPFKTHGNIFVDIRKGAFSRNPALQAKDFQAKATKNKVAVIKNTSNKWFRGVLTTGKNKVNRTGLTQFRLRFKLGDNDDLGDDFMKYYSGNAGTTSRPTLIVEYYIP